MNHIVVPTDFSENARKALNFAALLADRLKARLHLIHAFSLLENVFVDRKALRDAWNEEQQKEKDEELKALQAALMEQYPDVSCSCHLFAGPAVEVIMDYCQKEGADLIVMGTQGATGLAEVLVGSNTSALIARSHIPILAIPKEYPEQLPSSLVLATKNFEETPAQLRAVITLAEVFELPVKVLFFKPMGQEGDENEPYRDRIKNYTEWLQHQFPQLLVHPVLLEGQGFEETIQQYCHSHGLAILAMITYKRSFWDQLFAPSLTRKMAYHTHIPLLAIPA